MTQYRDKCYLSIYIPRSAGEEIDREAVNQGMTRNSLINMLLKLGMQEYRKRMRTDDIMEVGTNGKD